MASPEIRLPNPESYEPSPCWFAQLSVAWGTRSPAKSKSVAMIMSHIPATEAPDNCPMGNVFWQLRRLVLCDPSVTHRLPGSEDLFPTGTATWQPKRHTNSRTEKNAPQNHHLRRPFHLSVPIPSTMLRRSMSVNLVPKSGGVDLPVPYSHSHSHNENAQPR